MYTEVDIEKSTRGKREFDRLGGRGVPVILVGAKRLNGFSTVSFEKIYKGRAGGAENHGLKPLRAPCGAGFPLWRVRYPACAAPGRDRRPARSITNAFFAVSAMHWQWVYVIRTPVVSPFFPQYHDRLSITGGDAMTTSAENKETLVQTEDLPWVKMGDGVDIRILRVSEETGFWSAIIRMQPGAVFASHKHLAPADFLILKGKLKYRMGEAPAGAYGYEPTGAVHETTTCDEETELTFNAYGPSVFFNQDGSVSQILNHETALDMMNGKEQHFSAGKAKAAA